MKCVYLFWICLFSKERLFAQSADNKAVSVYRQTVGDQLGIYNGAIYERAANVRRGHSFFSADSLMNGSVYYNNFLYTDVPLLYDEVKDELVTPDFERKNLLELAATRVDYFSIRGHRFVKRNNGNAHAYYEQLYKGRMELLKKEVKKLSKVIVNQLETEWQVVAKTRYYLLRDNSLFTIRNKRTFLKLMKEHRKSVSKYLDQKNIRYRKNTEEYLMRGVMHYNEISK